MQVWPDIYLDFGNVTELFEWKMSEYFKEMKSIDDIPVKVNVSTAIRSQEFGPIFTNTSFNWSNQKKSIGECIQRICSIFRCESYEADFYIDTIKFDIQSLRNMFPKLRRIDINCFKAEPNEQDIQNAQNILRAFLPHVENVLLHGVPLQENLSIQHIGMENLKYLDVYYRHNPKLDDLLTLNVESCRIRITKFSVRDVNRFFKLWTKGSFPKLQSLNILVRLENVSDWNNLFKGLNAEDAGDSEGLGGKRYLIENTRGVCAQVRIQTVGRPVHLNIHFNVSQVQRSSPQIWDF
ncbi:hypothetical protein B9Z55_011231 [Caenorhabditis nigoni]|uniref:Sdz-33 F-box domain-containing protein n=1 Tax=Caenorhabditis nigoni TaxID=1611254 RepID=A0A2G5UJ71_9PELO|nr:hypothetical protein B9Z55_011231 [Caenorhabditis nigoni]